MIQNIRCSPQTQLSGIVLSVLVEVIRLDVRLGDILLMKKAHPCGSKEWKVLRTGMDFRLKCLGCGHEIMGARSKLEKNIREIRRGEE